MDKEAVAAFIRCTYDRYFDKTKGFSAFEAVFTDEPSLMSGYVNCAVPMPRTYLPWTEEMPEKFREMHGRDLWADIPVLFSREERFEEGKLRFWQTVAELMNEAFFDQIEKWCAYMLRGARWDGKIGMYYPIETSQGYYCPEWIGEASLEGGSLSANGLTVDVVVLPAVSWLDGQTREKLRAFEKTGGLLLWVGAKPDGEESTLCDDPVGALRSRVDYGLRLKADRPESVFVSLHEKNGKRMWYLINSSTEENKVSISPKGQVRVWHTFTGENNKKKSFVMPPTPPPS